MVHALGIIECQRLEPDTDLSAAMAGTVARLAAEGWQAECEADFGFTFVRSGQWRLLSMTERDPYSEASQSFSPFGDHHATQV